MNDVRPLFSMKGSDFMSNSALVSYTKISPNKNSPRNHAIDTISIHCVVGQLSVESIGNIFAPSSAGCSANYGIGTDGRIGMYVEEKDRSWCTSSSANDNRAITIECASDTTSPYAVNDKVYKSLINLLVDICQRNGIKSLKWQGNKALIGRVDKQNMTVHRWFANKACPGDYLYNLHGQIAAEVNKRLGVSSGAAAPASKPQQTSGTDAEKTIWNFLSGKGLNDFAVAGIMGNLFAESALNPENLQNTFEKKLNMTDDQYTAAVDNGSYTNFVRDSAGYGLAQWTYWSRKQALLDHAKSQKASIGDLDMQLSFLWKELSGYTAVMNTLKSAASVLAASNAILTGYEKPADQSATVQKKRAEYGQKYYDKYAKKAATPAAFTPYTVKVTATDLRIRKGAGTNTAIVRYCPPGVYTIVAESDGPGASKWGQLKSGEGWIALDYAKKL